MKSYPFILIFISILSLSLTSVGGSYQVSRICLLALLPFILIRLNKIPKIRTDAYSWRVLFFSSMALILAIFSIFWSLDSFKTLGYIATLIIHLIPLIAIALMSDSERDYLKKWIPKAWLFSALVILPLAFYELITGNHVELWVEEISRGGGIASLMPFARGLHGNFNDFSLFLVFCLFGIMFTGGKSVSLFWYRIAMLVGVLILVVVMVNLSRGAILTSIGLLIARFYPLISTKRGLFTIGLAAIIIRLLFLDLDQNKYLEYFKLKFSDYSHDLESEDGRSVILIAGLEGVIQTLGLGVGAGASSLYLATQPHVGIPNPHNLFLEWILNFGILGFFLLVWFLFSTFRAASKITDKGNRRLIYAYILLMPLFGVIQSHLTGYTYFWLALATATLFTYAEKNIRVR